MNIQPEGHGNRRSLEQQGKSQGNEKGGGGDEVSLKTGTREETLADWAEGN